MKKVFFTFLLAGFNVVAFNQVIEGTVFEIGTDSVISSATIYFDGAFVGTLADKNGNFRLDITKYASMPLTVSSIGYYSVTLTNYRTDKPLKIYLTPKMYEMNEVVISSKPLFRERKAYLKLFKDELLGTTYNAQNCEIINENDISFNYDSCQDTLRAFATNPLIINNRALGYKITYYLDKFEYYRRSRSFMFVGNLIFNEDLISNKTDKNLSALLYEKRRYSTYLGSRMHFFRALWKDGMTEAGFSIRNSDDGYLSYTDIVRQEDIRRPDSPDRDIKHIIYSGDLKIYYNGELSTMIFLKPRVYFNKDGKYDNMVITWEGEMIKKRIGDMLPDVYNESYNSNR